MAPRTLSAAAPNPPVMPAGRPEVTALNRHARRKRSYTALLCPTLAQGLQASIEHAADYVQPSGADAFVSLAASIHAARNTAAEAGRAELRLLRGLLQETPSRRHILAKYCYNLIGAGLSCDARSQAIATLRAAAAFGTPRLGHMVESCAPLGCGPEQRLMMLEGLWHIAGPRRLPHLMGMARPMLEQRRHTPSAAADAMQTILRKMDCAQREGALADRLGHPITSWSLSEVQEHCLDLIGDNTENVMQSARIASAGRAIEIVRHHVPDPLHFEPVLACIELYIDGLLEQATGDASVQYHMALRTLRGPRTMVQSDTEREASWSQRQIAHLRTLMLTSSSLVTDEAPPFDSTQPGLTSYDQQLWRNVRLEVQGAEAIGMGELCSLVWQAIHRYRNPELSAAQMRRVQANLRYSLVARLADCHPSHRIVCPVGVSQQLLSVLQAYLPFIIDDVEHEAHPEAVVTYLLQSFAWRCEKASKACLTMCEMARFEAMEEARILAFYDEALDCGATLFAARPDAHDTFRRHLNSALRLTYNIDYIDGPGVD